MFPLATFYFQLGEEPPVFEDGPVVSLPSELATKAHIIAYRNSRPGWNKCSLGYSFFVREGSDGSRLVIPGIVLDDDTPRKKLYFPPIKFTKSRIEKMVAAHIMEQQFVSRKIDETRRETEAELNLLVHDLRQFSSAIYNAAFQARGEYDRQRLTQCRELIETVLATQAMLSVRIDSLDLASNPSLLVSQPISVYRKVDKMVRSFQPEANNKRIDLSITGNSFGVSTGPDVFELIPFALIQNAVKYSPAGNPVSVRVFETPDVIQFDVTSIGPEIEDDEFVKIFERHYRGKNATDTGRAGSGIGLSNARMLVENHFGGRIWANQERALRFQIGLVEFRSVTFHVQVPRSG
jgi:signal transduction histidine kinase